MKKLALDWDDQQLRMVVGEVSASRTRLLDAAIIPLHDGDIKATLQQAVSERGLERTECLVVVGRDRAELRQMQFPPVPMEELPDLVRFQAVRMFASAGDAATIDYLPTQSNDEGISAIVSATGPDHLTPINKAVDGSGLKIGRIVLRPLAAAALYSQSSHKASGTVALIDLVGDEAEITLLREQQVVFVRSVRLPENTAARCKALAGELKRSLMASGLGDSTCNIIVWGTESRHREEIEQLREQFSASEPSISTLDPFDLVDSDDSVEASVGETVGRLAPLIGVLSADQRHSDQLIDFANPRRFVEKKQDPRKLAAMIAIPAAIVLGALWMIWSQFRSLDREIAQLETANAQLREEAKTADDSVARTGRIDAFLNGDVNWLDEIARLSETMPPSDKLILERVTGIADVQRGGGRLIVSGLVTGPDVIEQFEASVRDTEHRVVGDGSSQIDTQDAYRWRLRESVTVDGDAVQKTRYERMTAMAETTNESPTSEVQNDAT
ncbi:MAG: hypothetical protein AAGC97_00660 [Planctomycetota bacterium]